MDHLQTSASHHRAKSKSEIQATVRRLAPFHHAIDLPFGLSTFVPELSRQTRERTRLQTFLDHAWGSILTACGGSLKGKRVLDIACNCGGFSVHAANSGADYVFGIDIDAHYVEQASFVGDALGLSNVEFQQLDLLDLDPSTHGKFDLVLCLGILYHLENPVLSMKRISAVTGDVLVVDTTLMKVPIINPVLDRWPLWHMRRVSGTTSDATNISTSRWRPDEFCQFSPNSPAVRNLLEYCGFTEIARLKAKAKNLEKRYYSGRRATFIAQRRRSSQGDASPTLTAA
ncbi:methyltransferase domain-containing protein [Sinorhizobium medicae]|uniref:class I SAM-dependent methyltransferase n=1 Tax=Sinorhizobium medicae TaxID=110321 RepID=UPI002AF6CABA|nr:methyltransferase domain-containing protein [Sinorhizobium medicae]WQO43768.1 methyltransferase domain-containing protein [Sinorhizobium medicae]WQO67258.1 methyltransferase domain-containing protein [Sinorhizobium medicae]WQO70917.1 methyltransferase domain-containing protein [Sinorhizobium medicae]WQO93838.1 methyltransferase domain-containing protein [Sinorhizobium medicae]